MAIKDYFFFTKQERRGVIILLMIICTLIGVRVCVAAMQTGGGEVASGYRRYIKKDVGRIELNAADSIQLQELRGIGPGFAKRIVVYREQLGGYYCTEQLLEVYGFTEKLYNQVKGNVTVDATKIRKLNINKLNISQLKRHPYISYYEARAIYDYRMGRPDAKIHSLSEISSLPDLKDNWELIKRYISVE